MKIKNTQNGKCNLGTGMIKWGVSFGSVLAMIISFNIHKSVLLAILHGVLSWLYVIFYLVF